MEHPVEKPGSVLAHRGQLLDDFLIVGDVPHDRFQQVDRGDQPFDPSELICNQRQVEALLLDELDKLNYKNIFRNIKRRPQ